MEPKFKGAFSGPFLLPLLILLIAMVSIQYGASLAKSLFPLAGIAGTSTLRLTFASLMLLTLYRPWRKKFSSSEWKSLLLYGGSLGLMNLSFYFALERIPLGVAVTLEFTGPLAVAVFSSRKKIDFLWALMACIGILLLVPREATEKTLDPIGMMFALFAGFCWAFYIIFGKRAGNTIHGPTASAIGMSIAALFVLPWGIALDHAKIFDSTVLPLGLAVALLGSALPYTLEMVALKRIPARTFGILMSLEPAIASLIGFIFLAETLGILQGAAIGCVVFASLGSSLSSHD